MMLPYMLNLVGNEKLRLTSIFGASLSQKIEKKKKKIFWLTMSKVTMTLTSEREIAADNDMRLTHPTH